MFFVYVKKRPVIHEDISAKSTRRSRAVPMKPRNEETKLMPWK